MSEAYDKYLVKHRSGVAAAAEMLIRKNLVPFDIIENLRSMIKAHDASKNMADEYLAYDAYFYDVGTEGKTLRETEEAFYRAFLKHMHRNNHHWQHWVLPYDDAKSTRAIEMDKTAAYEMVCDWWSFSLVNKKPDEIFGWYEDHKDIMILHGLTRELVESLLDGIRKIVDGTTEEEWRGLYSEFGIE